MVLVRFSNKKCQVFLKWTDSEVGWGAVALSGAACFCP